LPAGVDDLVELDVVIATSSETASESLTGGFDAEGVAGCELAVLPADTGVED
jgi:hypothetical protein